VILCLIAICCRGNDPERTPAGSITDRDPPLRRLGEYLTVYEDAANYL
jgi:hypothetical protein